MGYGLSRDVSSGMPRIFSFSHRSKYPSWKLSFLVAVEDYVDMDWREISLRCAENIHILISQLKYELGTYFLG